MKKGILILVLLYGWSAPYLWDLSPYGQEKLIDVIIPCIEKDSPILEACIQGIKSHLKEIRRVIVVSPTRLTESAEWYPESQFPFSLQDIGNHLCETGMQDHPRRGWFLQQLLKFYAPFVIPDLTQCVLVLDADTIFLQPFSAFSPEGKLYFDISFEYWQPYFEQMQRLHPTLSRKHRLYSGISHHMVFDRMKLEKLFEMVEEYHQKPFWMAFLHTVDPQVAAVAGASEYEIYFNYCISHYRDGYIFRSLKNRDNLTSLDRVKEFQKRGYQVVSCHSYYRESKNCH